MKITNIVCDIDGCDNKPIQDNIDKRMQVIFTTEQTEGRSTKPYITDEEIDICENCLDQAANGNAIFAHGAQGHNHYFFMSDWTIEELRELKHIKEK